MKKFCLFLCLVSCPMTYAANLSEGEVGYLCRTLIEEADYGEFAYYLSKQELDLSVVYNELKCDYGTFGQPEMPLMFGMHVPHHLVISRVMRKFYKPTHYPDGNPPR